MTLKVFVFGILFGPFEKWGGTLYSGALVFSFFLFSTQNQLPQIIIVTLTTFEKFQNFSQCREKPV